MLYTGLSYIILTKINWGNRHTPLTGKPVLNQPV
jgi:hypothetical protein